MTKYTFTPSKNASVKGVLAAEIASKAQKFCSIEDIPCGVIPFDIVEKLNKSNTNTVMFIYYKRAGLFRGRGFNLKNFTMIEPEDVSRYLEEHPEGCVVDTHQFELQV